MRYYFVKNYPPTASNFSSQKKEAAEFTLVTVTFMIVMGYVIGEGLLFFAFCFCLLILVYADPRVVMMDYLFVVMSFPSQSVCAVLA